MTMSAPTKYLEVRDALRARREYEKACEELYDFLLVDFPELEEMLKIGKRGSKVRQRERHQLKLERGAKIRQREREKSCAADYQYGPPTEKARS
jgi:hypothetical protein